MHHWSKIAIVLGSADCVWDDYTATNLLLKQYVDYLNSEAKPFTHDVMIENFVINDTIPVFPGHVHHAISLHPNKFAAPAKDGSGNWAHKRNANGYPIPDHIWGHRGTELTTNTSSDWGGSSGLFACKIALELGHSRIIMCGVPLDPKQRHIVRHTDWNSAKAFQRGWITRKATVLGKVKSWEGWTKDLLGIPTIEWLQSE